MTYPPTLTADRTNGQTIQASDMNSAYDAIDDIVAELGSDPGDGSTVTARLTALDSTVSGKAATSHAHSASTDITSGTVPTARLGTGTASSTTALFGDQTYKTVNTSVTPNITAAATAPVSPATGDIWIDTSTVL